jgi:hypothetical protein
MARCRQRRHRRGLALTARAAGAIWAAALVGATDPDGGLVRSPFAPDHADAAGRTYHAIVRHNRDGGGDADGAALQSSRRRDGDVGVASLAAGRSRWSLRGGTSTVAAWVAGRLPPAAQRTRPRPPLEVASAWGFRSEGRIVEIASSGRRVAALVDESRRDCDHAVAWTVGSRRVVRFSAPSTPPCQGEEPEHFFGLRLTGTKLAWNEFSCGSLCYHIDFVADVRRPGRQVVLAENEVEDENPPGHPPPRPERRRGVRMTVLQGEIVLQRLADGRVRTIRPAGTLADADLEPAGLFYAHNVRRSRQAGRLVFIPLARIFS